MADLYWSPASGTISLEEHRMRQVAVVLAWFQKLCRFGETKRQQRQRRGRRAFERALKAKE